MSGRRSATQIREDALAIWQAGVDAVASDKLVAETVAVDGNWLKIGEDHFPLAGVHRLAIVGAGKAGAGMAEGLLRQLASLPSSIEVAGWLNVPADCVRQLSHLPQGDHVRLHAARPAGRNEPTEEGVAGTRQILQLVRHLRPNDLCLCLLSGGGSALLPAPIDRIDLAEKQALTRFLSGAGANIWQLNSVRKMLSEVKGGGLARACCAGHLITLIISDVLGDPLDIIASGPTVPNQTTPAEALQILERFRAPRESFPQAYAWFEAQQETEADGIPNRPRPPSCNVVNRVIGNNARAVDAAGQEAERRGYSHAMHARQDAEGAAEEVGRHLARMARRMRDAGNGSSQTMREPDCLITGGEPTVELAPAAQRGLGGRNQQLVLAALDALRQDEPDAAEAARGLVVLSGGTDGEDGPTDAAGAFVDQQVAQSAAQQQLDPEDYLRRNDAYHFFQQAGGLLKTGATHTNVCDLRVVVVDRVG